MSLIDSELSRTRHETLTPSSVVDFDLKLFEDHGSFWVEAMGSPALRSDPVPLRLPAEDELRRWLTAFHECTISQDDVREMSRELYRSLFPPQIEARFRSEQCVLHRGVTLRIRLDIRDSRLAVLPWELSAPPSAFAFVLSPRTPMTRCVYGLDGNRVEPRIVNTEDPLRVLVVAPSVRGEKELNFAGELAAIREGLESLFQSRTARLRVLDQPTYRALREALADPDGYDVLHFMGHGEFDGQRSSLVFADDHGAPDLVDGEELGATLCGSSLRLFTVASCESATPSQVEPLLGVAESALRAGVPAVVAMQRKITDEVAASFSGAFYRSLAMFSPLEDCVSAARHSQARSKDGAWAAPVLFSNVPDGNLFAPSQPTQPRAALLRKRPGRRNQVGLHLPPASYTRFVGRQLQLDQIVSSLTREANEQCIVISGESGVGKSSLAREAARLCWQVSAGHPQDARAFSGVIWTSPDRVPVSAPFPALARSGWTFEELYQQIASSLASSALTAARPYERWRLLQAALQQERYLVVVDDVDELRDISVSDLVELIPPPSAAIMTTSTTLEIPATCVNVFPMSQAEALSLMKAVADNYGVSDDRIPAVAETHQKLAEADGLPLALRLMMGQVVDGSSRVQVSKHHTFATVPPISAQLGWLVRDAIERLAEPELTCLQFLALYPEPLQIADLAALVGGSVESTGTLLSRLVRLGLVNVEAGTAHILDRARQQALSDMDPETGNALVRSVVRHNLAIVEGAQGLPDRQQSETIMSGLRNHLWSALQAYSLHDWDAVLRYAKAMYEPLFRQQFYNEGIQLGIWACDAANRTGRRSDQAERSLYPVARHYYYQHDYLAAREWSERALDLYELDQDTQGMISAQRYLGRALQALGFRDQAKNLFTKALASARGLELSGNLRAHLLAALASIAEDDGDYDAAKDEYQKALELYELTGDWNGVATTERKLGLLELGSDPAAADAHLNRSLELFQQHDFPDRLAKVLQSKAMLAEHVDDLASAYELLTQAREILERLPGAAELAEVDAALARVDGQLRGSAVRGASTVRSRDRGMPTATVKPTERSLVAQSPKTASVGQVFSVIASIRIGKPGGAASSLLKPFDVPPGGATVHLIALADGLEEVSGSNERDIHVPQDGDTEPQRFEFRADKPGPRDIDISAWWGGTFLGRVDVQVDLEIHAMGRETVTRSAAVDMATRADDVSLLIKWDELQKHYRFQLIAPDTIHREVLSEGLLSAPRDQVEQMVTELDRFAEAQTGLSPKQARDYLEEQGVQLWRKLLPLELRQQFWEHRDRMAQLTIVADRDVVPWELLYPLDEGHGSHGFLVEQLAVTRWMCDWAPTNRASLDKLRFVLPPGAPPEAGTEIAAVRAALPAGFAEGTPISTLDQLAALIRDGSFSALHFACHNRFDPVTGPAIRLDDRDFTPVQMSKAEVLRPLAGAAPLVFLNACRSASGAAAWTELSGWASAFIRAGAGALIGTSWSVRDLSAKIFAESVYSELAAGESLGAAVMAARQAIKDQPADSSWLAYSVYGNAHLTAA